MANAFDQFDEKPANAFDRFDKPSGVGRRIADIGLDIAQGVVGLPEAGVGIADLATGGRVGKTLEGAGYQPKRAREALADLYSPERQAANVAVGEAETQAVDEAKAAGGGTVAQIAAAVPAVAKAAVENPSTIVGTIAQSLPSTFGGGAIARGLLKLAPRVAPAVAAGVGEGVLSAGQNAEQVREESPTGTLDPEQSAILAASGALTGGIGAGSATVAKGLGIQNIETLLATGKLQPGTKGLVRRVAQGALTEGLLEELPQSAQEQVAQNLAQGKPWNEGVAQQMVMGFFAGAGMGAGANLMHGAEAQAPAIARNLPQPTPGNAVEYQAPTAADIATMKAENLSLAPDAQNTGGIDYFPPNPLDRAAAVEAVINRPTPTFKYSPEQQGQQREVERDLQTGAAPLESPKIAIPGEATPGRPVVAPTQSTGEQYVDALMKSQRGELLTTYERTLLSNPPPGPNIEVPEPRLRDGGPLSRVVNTGIDTGAVSLKAPFPFGSEQAATRAAGDLGERAVVPHPTQPGKFAVVPAKDAALQGVRDAASAVRGASKEETKAATVALGEATDAAEKAGIPRIDIMRAIEGAPNARAVENPPGAAAGGSETGSSTAAALTGRVPVQGATAEGANRPEQAASAEAVEQAAHQAATSPKNELAPPTDAQKGAGNYQKGHVKLQGLDISIENPAGSKRRPEWPTLKSHYGYIKGTVGKDKDHVDVFIGKNPASDKVFVVDQASKDGKFDEHKVMLGFDTIEEARKGYLDNYTKGWNGLKTITPTTMGEFKTWLDSGNTRSEFASTTKETPDAEAVRSNPRSADRTGAAAAGSEDVSGEDLQQQAQAGAEAGDRQDGEAQGVEDFTTKKGEVKVFTSKKRAEGFKGMRINGVPKNYQPRKTEDGWLLSRPRRERTPAQKANDARLKMARSSINMHDSLSTMMGKLGGLALSDIEDDGFDRAAVKHLRSGVIGKPAIRVKGGLSMDAMTEALSELGWNLTDEQGNYDQTMLRELVDESIDGDVYTPEGYEYHAARDAEERAKLEAQTSPAIVEKSGYDDLSADGRDFVAEAMNERLDELLAVPDEALNQEAISDEELAKWEEEDAWARGDAEGPASRGAAEGAQGGQDTGQSGEAKEVAALNPETPAAAGVSTSGPALELKGETEAEIRSREAKTAKQTEEKEKQAAAPDAGDFLLTGSNSAADQARARGQQELAPAAEPKLETKNADVGENLWYNRRNFTGKALAWDDVKGLNDALKVKEVVKAKVWPRPDYEQLIADGLQPFFARLIKQTYDGIATAPAGKSDADMERYIAVVGRVREALFSWAKDVNANKAFLDVIAARAQAQLRRGPISLTAMLGDQKAADITGVLLDRLWPDEMKKVRYDRFGRGTEAQADLRAIGGNRALRALQFTLDDAVDAMKDLDKGWPAKQEAWERQGYKLAPSSQAQITEGATYGSGGVRTPLWTIQTAEGWSGRTVDTFESKDAAEAALKVLKPIMLLDKRNRLISQHDSEDEAKAAARELVKREAKGGDLRGMNVAAAEREGPDRRAGTDISSQRLMDEFGFRGVNFGREGWINQAERQAYLNHAYDGLHDLSEILGVPPKALSLNGMLGLAFGAQGRGGNAAAHFVPGVNEINLTKTMGAGTLAHEWGHALDHYFAAQAGQAKADASYLSEVITPAAGAEIRPEIVSAMREVVQAMKKRDLTPKEIADRRQASKESALKNLNRWLEGPRAQIKDPAMAAKFDELAARMRKGDLGDGSVKSGNKEFSPVVASLRNLMKEATGRVMALETINAIDSWAASVEYYAEEKQAADTHISQSPTTYASESSSADRGKGGKQYWSTPREMFARAFELYVADQLVEAKQLNTFLSDAPARAAAMSPDGKGFAYPYPRGLERTTINSAIDKLVTSLQTRDTDRGVAMFHREASAGKSSTVAEVRKWVGPAIAKMTVPVTIVGTVEEAKKLTGLDIASDTDGLYSGSKIVLITENMADRLQAESTLFHELFHVGLANRFGRDIEGYNKALRGLAMVNSGLSSQAKKWNQRFGADARAAYEKSGMTPEEALDATGVLSIEEALADLSGAQGEKLQLRGLKRFLAAVQQFLRNMGFTELAKWMEGATDAEAITFIAQARSRLEVAGKPAVGIPSAQPAFHRAYHGSPHDFDRFDISKIGTGEGAQAFGFGLYFAGKKEIAEFYRKKLAKDSQFIYDGKPVYMSSMNVAERARFEMADAKRRGIDPVTEVGKLLSKVTGQGPATFYKDVLKEIAKLDPAKAAYDPNPRRGRTYEVELAPREEQYLDWDKPLSKQSAYVKQRLKGFLDEMDDGVWGDEKNPTGEQIYHQLGWGRIHQSLGGDRAASDLLDKAGIPGLRYRDATSRGALPYKVVNDAGTTVATGFPSKFAAFQWINKQSDTTGLKPIETEEGLHHNYVIFDDRHVSIAAKFHRTGTPDWVASGPAALQTAAAKIDTYAPGKTVQQKVKGLAENWKERLIQGAIDAYAPLKRLGAREYILARMVKAGDGALEGMMLYGKPKMHDDGSLYGEIDKKGFLGAMQDLQGEHDRFLMWVAGNRSQRLMDEKREHLFSAAEIQAMTALNKGAMKDGSSRMLAYSKAAAVLADYNKAVLDIAEKTGLIDPDARHLWEHDFYVPFFRVDEDMKLEGPSKVKGLVRQQAFQKLKGGTEPLGDLLENSLRNWSHLLTAALANQAAVASLQAAERTGIARKVPAAIAPKGATYAMVGGEKVHYEVDDPFILTAISAMEAAPFKGVPMKVLGAFKHALTLGVTTSPPFRIRNLLRDTVTALGVAEIGANPITNLMQGYKATDRKGEDYAQALFSGAMMRFGYLTDGKHAEHAKRLILSGVKDQTILDTPTKVRDALGKVWDEWQEFGDRMENVNRLALYKQRLAEGATPLQAAFEARDMMDFSLQGSSTAVRFLTQVVPFFNARLQGLYKLGRAAHENPARLGYVVGATTLASIALLLAYSGDDEWKKREDWDRDNFWWFRIGDIAYRIPKPFEIGAVATIAERGLELMISDEMTGKRFAQRMVSILGDQLSMNPTPQFFKPMLDIYANTDSFTGRQIETKGMENLSKPERAGPNTSLVAKTLGKAGDVTNLSPIQIDHLIRGYFGWVGTHVADTVDLMAQPFMADKPARKLDDYMLVGDFAKELPSNRSRYLEDFYKQAKEVHEVMGDIRHARELRDFEKMKRLLEENRDKVALAHMYQTAERRIGVINSQLLKVQSSGLKADEKRVEVDRLSTIRNELAKTVQQRVTERRAAATQ